MKGFTIIDNKTGKYPDCEEIALKEDWAKHLCYCDVDAFAITEDGSLILLDDCGKCAFCPDGRFTVVNDDGWISVKDRLPERDKEVLLIVHGWEDRLYYTGCLHRQEAERSWLTGIESKASDWKIWGFSYLREPIVTHWMPLPEPPKGE